MARKYPQAGKDGADKDGRHGFERPSERLFRRSRAAENRRRKSQNKDARFFRIVSGVATVGIFIVLVIIAFMTRASYGGQ